MSIETKPITSGGKAAPPPKIDNDLADLIQTQIMEATSQATERAFKYADMESRRLLANVKDQLSKMEAPEPVCLDVQVNDLKAKLSHSAHPLLGKVLATLKAGEPPFLAGPAGCGKTWLGAQAAEALSVPFYHVCLGMGVSEMSLYGRQHAQGFTEGPLTKSFRDGGVLLVDEIDNADPNAMVAIQHAVEGGKVTNLLTGEVMERNENFYVIACANTFGKGADMVYTGRNRLDGATLNRFFMFKLGYEKSIEKKVCPDEKLRKHLQKVRKNLEKAKATEIISTRTLRQAYRLKMAEIPEFEILESISMSWSDHLVKSSKVLEFASDPEPKKPAKAEKPEGYTGGGDDDLEF